MRLFVRGTARATEGALPHCLTHCLTLAASVSVCLWLWRNIKLKRDQHGATQLINRARARAIIKRKVFLMCEI